MSDAIYKISREIVIMVAVMIMINFVCKDEMARGISVLFMGGWYVLISHRYQNVYKIISPGYIYITFNMIVVYIFLASLITVEQINELNYSGVYGWWADDYYWKYFWCIFCIFLVVTMYLYVVEKERGNTKVINDVCANDVLFGIALLLAVYIASGRYNDFIYPVVILSLVQWLCFKQYKYIVLLVVVIILDGGSMILSRYNLIQVMLPMIFIYIYKYNIIQIPASKRFLYFFVFVFLAGVYGTVSEVIKLIRWGMDYSLIDVLSSSSEMLRFFERQFYRIFAIWIKLGGYIIYHVDNNDFFYGLSFIKGVSSFFEVKYVSIPELGAAYDNAVYAQPGTLVEGYANFGMVGAVFYMIIIFIFMEKMLINFMKKSNIENLICLTVPFTKILLDGGSLYSAIFIWLCCKVLFIGKRGARRG